MLIKGADGKTVLDNTLVTGAGEDSRSGLTSSGAPGSWTVRVKLTVYNGDGRFSSAKETKVFYKQYLYKNQLSLAGFCKS